MHKKSSKKKTAFKFGKRKSAIRQTTTDTNMNPSKVQTLLDKNNSNLTVKKSNVFGKSNAKPSKVFTQQISSQQSKASKERDEPAVAKRCSQPVNSSRPRISLKRSNPTSLTQQVQPPDTDRAGYRIYEFMYKRSMTTVLDYFPFFSFFSFKKVRKKVTYIITGMRIRIWIRSDPFIFGLPDPLLFPPDPTFNNGYIKLFPS